MEAWEKMGLANTSTPKEPETDVEQTAGAGGAEAEGPEGDAPHTPGRDQTQSTAGARLPASLGDGGPASRPGSVPSVRPRLGKPEDRRESSAEEFTRLMGHSAAAAQEGALASSQAMMRMANETAAARLKESEALAKKLLAETEAITKKLLEESKESIRKMEAAAQEIITRREAAIDQREKAVCTRETELARRELDHQEKVMGEHLALLDMRRRAEEELKPLRDAMQAERKAHIEQMVAERKAQHESLQEQLAAETKSHRQQIELMTAQAKEITTQAKEMASERADYSKKLVDNVNLGAGALLKIAETVQKQADLVGQMSELSAGTPPPPKTTGPEVIGNVAMSFFDAIKTLGVTALQANPKLAKALEGPLGKGAELAKLGEQAAAEAGFVPVTRAEVTSEAARPESPPPPDPAAVALDLPLAVLNKPEVLQQLQAKFGPDYLRKARLADFVKLAQETPGHAG